MQSFLKSLPIERENLWFGCKLVLHSAPDHSGGNTCEKPMYTPSMMMFSTFALPSWNARSGNQHTDDNDIASVNLPVTMLLLTYSVPHRLQLPEEAIERGWFMTISSSISSAMGVPTALSEITT